MKLFKKDGYDLTISDEALLLVPFAKLWNRDKSKDKHKALMELGYIYFMEDPRSDYKEFINRDQRHIKIVEGEALGNNWTPDKDVQAAMEFYASFTPASALLLDDLKKSVDTLRAGLTIDENLQDIDLEKRPRVLSTYADTVAKLMDLAVKIDSTEKQLYSSMTQEERIKGSKEKGALEDI